MPFKSAKKRRLYAHKWRQTHPKYMTEYADAKRTGATPTCLLGYRTDAPDSVALAPLPDKISPPAHFALAPAK